jgi:hypothetical protein
MPTVGNANEVAKTNQDYFMQGMDAIGQGIIKGGENKREDEKQAWLEDKDYRDFQHKLAQDRLAQMNETRNYFLRRDQYNMLKDKQEYDQARQDKQDEWLQKFYDQYFANDPAELERQKLLLQLQSLDAQLTPQGQSDASLVINGLNPMFNFRK